MTKIIIYPLLTFIWIITGLLTKSSLYAQNKKIHQTLLGTVYDPVSGLAIENATIEIIGLHQAKTKTNAAGRFIFENIPIGRYELKISYTGYESTIIKEVFVGSVQQLSLEVPLYEKVTTLQEVSVKPKAYQAEPLNQFATVGAQMFQPEQASRFAGGMDDPARLVSNYAGVTTPSISSNGISVRGNAPSLLQWRLEGVEIPSPNHFSDINLLGGGLLSALSSNVMGNSDFLIGSFPAEYSNAISGVFDLKMRKGNTEKYQHSFQLGLLGIDLASEGPISKANNASYIINYRYSTTGLLEKIKRNKDLGGKLGYQDLNFHLNFPTKKSGTFSIWAMGLKDEVAPIIDQPLDRKYIDEGILSSAEQQTGAAGIAQHYYFDNNKTSLKNTFATTYLGHHIDEEFYNLDKQKSPKTNLTVNTTHFIFSSTLKHKFNSHHHNQTGITLTHIKYDMNLNYAPYFEQAINNYISSNGSTDLISGYSNSQFHIANDFKFVAGLNVQHLRLNKNTAIEPRLGLKWNLSSCKSISAAYGLHSRMEKPDVYFVKDDKNTLVNNNLAFLRSHQLTFSYNQQLAGELHLKIEPYLQLLDHVPITENGTYSILNRIAFYTTQKLISKGKGQNYGIDLTLSKYLTKGFYYMLTTSLFDSKYKAADGQWYNTRYNRQYIINFLTGKEWILGNDILGINVKASTMGGQKYTPIDEAATHLHPDKEVQYRENEKYSNQFSPMFIGDFSLSYKMNRGQVSHTFALKSVNATRQKEYVKHKYNLINKTIEPFFAVNSLFNLSYRIDL